MDFSGSGGGVSKVLLMAVMRRLVGDRLTTGVVGSGVF